MAGWKRYFTPVTTTGKSSTISSAMLYGTRFHEAAEFYVKDDTELPPYFTFAKAALDNLKQLPGEKLCEYQMGVTKDLEPCAHEDIRNKP